MLTGCWLTLPPGCREASGGEASVSGADIGGVGFPVSAGNSAMSKVIAWPEFQDASCRCSPQRCQSTKEMERIRRATSQYHRVHSDLMLTNRECEVQLELLLQMFHEALCFCQKRSQVIDTISKQHSSAGNRNCCSVPGCLPS